MASVTELELQVTVWPVKRIDLREDRREAAAEEDVHGHGCCCGENGDMMVVCFVDCRPWCELEMAWSGIDYGCGREQEGTGLQRALVIENGKKMGQRSCHGLVLGC
ncbi:hypothetical protein M0R45_035711 [Rubus argutus]|uniref:Uncharacterized protein n=1 Tax=Rubus argutus TaxID=59490 RepID=A0AAW1VWU5_RUBAR